MTAALRMLPTPAMVEKRTMHVYAALLALKVGQLTDERFNELTIFLDAFECMGRIKGGKAGKKLQDAAEAAMLVLANVRDRWKEGGHFGATGDELNGLWEIAKLCEDTMRRNAMGLTNKAFDMALNRYEAAFSGEGKLKTRQHYLEEQLQRLAESRPHPEDGPSRPGWGEMGG